MTNDENLSIQSVEENMNPHSKSKSLLALVLAITIAATGCSAQWINIALQDLPVLTRMALNIATLVGTLATGKQTNNADLAVVQNISAQASRVAPPSLPTKQELKRRWNEQVCAASGDVLADAALSQCKLR